MGQAIRIRVGKVTLAAELNDTPTARALWEALPITGRANLWGEEIYFRIPVQQEAASDARVEMEVGELAYWPPGQAFCIFFGPTPASINQQPRAASPVNPVGRVTETMDRLREVRNGAEVRVEQA